MHRCVHMNTGPGRSRASTTITWLLHVTTPVDSYLSQGEIRSQHSHVPIEIDLHSSSKQCSSRTGACKFFFVLFFVFLFLHIQQGGVLRCKAEGTEKFRITLSPYCFSHSICNFKCNYCLSVLNMAYLKCQQSTVVNNRAMQHHLQLRPTKHSLLVLQH